MIKSFLLIFVLIIGLTIKSYSQNYSYQLFGPKNGLETPELLSVFEDSRGYMWIGGVNGITKFNGNSFINYNQSNGLTDNIVLGINESKNHNLWISTKTGISSFNGKIFKNYKIVQKDTTSKIFYFQNVFESSNGDTYTFGTKGLFLLNKIKEEFIQIKDLNATVREIAEDKNGNLWIASNKGLYKLYNNKFSLVKVDTSSVSNSITCIAIEKSGLIWIGTSKGIYNYDGNKITKHFINGIYNDKIRDILISKDDKIIFTYDAPELKIYKNGIFNSIDLNYLVSNASILRIIQDRDNNFWLASSTNLIKMYSKKISKYFLSDSIKAPVMNIATDKLNNLYFATTDGLFKYKNNKLEKFNISNKPNQQFITSLFITDTALLVGTLSGQAFSFKNNKFTPFGNTDFDTDNPIYQMLQYNKNELWLCKGYNVVQHKNKKYSIHTFAPQNPSFTQSALVDSKKRIWFAHANILTLYENGIFKSIDSKQGFNFSESATLVEDTNHNIWIGTFGYGLIKYDGKNFTAITTNENIASNYLTSCIYDKKNNCLWIGTTNGVSNIFLDNKGNISSITNYNKEQGLDDVGCNQNAIFQLQNSNILIGTANGLYEYDSKLTSTNNNTPKLNFTGIRLNYETPNWNEFTDSLSTWSNTPLNLILPYNKNHVTFDFIGINLDAPSNVKYQWKLEGFDNDWNPISKTNFTSYSNLPSGNYTFKLRASNSSGIWSTPILYSFIITPPFWKTSWFIITSIIIVSIMIWGFFKYRINQIQKKEFEKTENFKKITELELKSMRSQMNPHFMFNALNSIQDVIFSKDNEKATIYLADFAKLMRLILENSTLKKIKLSDEIEFLKLYLNLEQLRFQDKFNIQLIVADDIDDSSIFLPPMLIQTYIENAIIHGLMHKVNNGILIINFGLINNKKTLKCTITDNGIGRKKANELSNWKTKKHKSMGIEITSERITLLNTIETLKGYNVIIDDLVDDDNLPIGTEVTIFIPIA